MASVVKKKQKRKPSKPVVISTKLELQKRISYIQDLLLKDFETRDIIASAKKKWKVTERQAYRYLWAANIFFVEKSKQTLERKVAFYLARKRKLLRDLPESEVQTSTGTLVVSKILDSMAKLEGVSIETLKLIGDPKQPVSTISQVGYTSTIDYTKFPTPLLKQLLQMMDTN